MTLEEAKDILAAYRDDFPLDEFPEMSEALAMLETDDALRDWFEAEQKFDQEFSSAFSDIPIPGDLVGTVLAEAPRETDESISAPAESKIVAFPTRRLWMAAAAAVVLTAAALVKYFAYPPPVKFSRTEYVSVEAFREDMAYFANERFVLGHMTKDLNEARDWLKENQSPTYEETPGAILSYEGMGCQTFPWGPHKVSLVCFKNDDDDVVHLFVANKDAFKELMPADELQAMQVRKKLETGGWMTEDKVYLFVGSKPKVKIGQLLAHLGEV